MPRSIHKHVYSDCTHIHTPFTHIIQHHHTNQPHPLTAAPHSVCLLSPSIASTVVGCRGGFPPCCCFGGLLPAEEEEEGA